MIEPSTTRRPSSPLTFRVEHHADDDVVEFGIGRASGEYGFTFC